MVSRNKYNARSFYYDPLKDNILLQTEGRGRPAMEEDARKHCIFFASEHEFQVYQTLRTKFASAAISTQYAVPILPRCECYPKGKTWTVDFAVFHPSIRKTPMMLVEAKGHPTEGFKYQLALLNLSQPELFKKLMIVFSNSVPLSIDIFRNLSRNGCKDRLLTLAEFKNKIGSP